VDPFSRYLATRVVFPVWLLSSAMSAQSFLNSRKELSFSSAMASWLGFGPLASLGADGPGAAATAAAMVELFFGGGGTSSSHSSSRSSSLIKSMSSTTCRTGAALLVFLLLPPNHVEKCYFNNLIASKFNIQTAH